MFCSLVGRLTAASIFQRLEFLRFRIIYTFRTATVFISIG